MERRLPAAYWASSRRYGLFYCVKLLFCRIVIAQSLNSLYNRFTNSNVVDVGDRRKSGYNPNGCHPHPYYPDNSALRSLIYLCSQCEAWRAFSRYHFSSHTVTSMITSYSSFIPKYDRMNVGSDRLHFTMKRKEE